MSSVTDREDSAFSSPVAAPALALASIEALKYESRERMRCEIARERDGIPAIVSRRWLALQAKVLDTLRAAYPFSDARIGRDAFTDKTGRWVVDVNVPGHALIQTAFVLAPDGEVWMHERRTFPVPGRYQVVMRDGIVGCDDLGQALIAAEKERAG